MGRIWKMLGEWGDYILYEIPKKNKQKYTRVKTKILCLKHSMEYSLV